MRQQGAERERYYLDQGMLVWRDNREGKKKAQKMAVSVGLFS